MSDSSVFLGNPIYSKEDDLLDRSAIADRLSNLICNYSVKECCTIGISGSWGCGKTSIINMVKNNVGENGNSILIVDFNPVDYHTSSEGIARLFFSVIIAHLKEVRKTDSSLINGYKRDSTKILKVGAKTLNSIINSGLDLDKLIDNLSELSELITNPSDHDSIDLVRTKISNILFDSKVKIMIVIDDIDRLFPGEAIQILRLIRITAHFDNVVYVLGYDETVLSRQIDNEYGERYLEKYIQVPVHLPEVNQELIQKCLFNHFIEILNEYGFNVLNCSKKVCEYLELETMRDLYILLNRFSFKMAMCPQDICPEDLLVLSFVEMKNLELYNWFFEKRFELCRIKATYMREECIEDENNHIFDVYREYHKRSVDRRLRKAVLFIYPDLAKDYYPMNETVGRKDHINSFYSCSRYFMLNSSSIPVSNTVIDNIVNSDDKGQTLYEIMRKMASEGKKDVILLLDKLHERLSDLQILDCGSVARTLLYDVKDPDFCELFPYGPMNYAAWNDLLNDSLKEFGDEYIDQFIIQKMCYENPNALVMVLEYLRELNFSLKRNEQIPMSDLCLSRYLKKVEEALLMSADSFVLNEDPERTRFFLSLLSTVSSDKAKSVFDNLFNTDSKAYDYFLKCYENKHVIDFVPREIANYLSQDRAGILSSYEDGRLKELFDKVLNEYGENDS